MKTNIKLQEDFLWIRIQNFSLDVLDVDFPFSNKLAKEENWTLDFTKKAMEEYKKFVYLCCVLPNGAAPSDTVDKVWHMHLIYTKNYWEDFCPNILKRKLHHNPSKGGFAEKDKHEKWFSDTMTAYEAIFKQDAPKDIWTSEVKHSHGKWLKTTRFIPFFVLPLILISCVVEVGNTFAIIAVGSIGFFILRGFISWIFSTNNTKKSRNEIRNNTDGGGCGTSGGSCGTGGSCGSCGGCGGCSS